MPNRIARLDDVFRALAHPARRAVVERLTLGPASVSELAEPFDMALPSFLQHLDLLTRCGLVETAASAEEARALFQRIHFDLIVLDISLPGIGGVEWLNELRDAGYQVHVTAEDADMLPSYDQILDDESAIDVGRVRLRTIHTPGHTPGSMSFLVEGAPVLFSGDTLFPGGPGATKFPGGDFPTIIESIGGKLLTLPPDTLVLPGHGDDTTIGDERPHLQEWIDRGW